MINKPFISTDLIKDYFKTFKHFVNYMNANNNDQCLEYKPIKIYNDNTLREIIHKEYEIDNINKISIKERNKIIEKIYNEMDISIRQLSRILGVGKTIIEKAVKKDT